MKTPVEVEPHYMGAESEYSPNDFNSARPSWYANLTAPYNDPIDGVVSPSSDTSKFSTIAQLSNGGKLYRDVNDHLEACTPETSNPDDIVTYILASEELVVRSVAKHIALHNANNPGQEPSIVRIHRRLTTHTGPERSDFKDTSVGFHENYYVHVPEKGNRREHAKKLVPFLMGRTVFTGAGQAEIDPETGAAVFMPAQKARHLRMAESTATTRSKPWVFVRDEAEDHNGDIEGYMRVQVAGGDANISPWATHFAFASTDIVLTLMDNDIDLELAVLEREGREDIKEASQKVANNFQGDAKVNVLQGGEIVEKTPIELLDHYMNLALDNLHLFKPRQVEFLLGDWKPASDDYHANPMLLYDRADWICKQWLADMQREKAIKKNPDKALDNDPKEELVRLQKIDMHYDALTGFKLDNSGQTGPGLGWKLRKLGHFAYKVDWNEVEHALYHGPRDTRAFVRGETNRLLRVIPEEVFPGRASDWSKIYYKKTAEDTDYHKIHLSDPGGDLTDEAFEQLNTIKQLALAQGADKIATCPNPSCDACSEYRNQAKPAEEAA
jgi:hypothetical protein